jgi:hypothetical protein
VPLQNENAQELIQPESVQAGDGNWTNDRYDETQHVNEHVIVRAPEERYQPPRSRAISIAPASSRASGARRASLFP